VETIHIHIILGFITLHPENTEGHAGYIPCQGTSRTFAWEPLAGGFQDSYWFHLGRFILNRPMIKKMIIK
jgi:hypothetical protein